jgi:type III secretory pathway component EscV
MTSKAYLSIAGIFIALYILTSLGVIVGLPEWVHQACTVVFAGAAFLGVRKKKREQVSQVEG